MLLQQSEIPVLCLEREGRREDPHDHLVSPHWGKAGCTGNVRLRLAVPGDQVALLHARLNQTHQKLHKAYVNGVANQMKQSTHLSELLG